MPEANSNQRETRGCPSPPELRQRGKQQTITGHAAVFNSRSLDLGGFHEVIAPGSFRNVLAQNPDVRALINHDANQIVGRTSAGTMTLTEDAVGLHYSINLPDTQVGRDLATNVKLGNYTGSSFSFVIAPNGDEWRSVNGAQERTITEVGSLLDCGPVVFPAYPASTVVAASVRQRLRNGGSTCTPTPRLDAAKRRMELSEARYRSRAAAAPARQRELGKAELIEQFTNELGWTDWDGIELYKEQRKHVFRMNRFRRQRLEMQMRKAGLAR